MTRTFSTHKIRWQTELTQLWAFTPLSGEVSGEAAETRLVAVPSCWETYPGFGCYRGKAVYETTFQAGGNLRVVCKGVSHTAEVSLDGSEIARHYNAFTSFSGIMKNADKGKHSLRIEVSNEFSADSALHIPNDYMTYGGINRPVLVEEVPDVFIEWVHAVPEYEQGEWSLSIETKLNNIGNASRKAAVQHSLDGQTVKTETEEIPANGSIVLKSRKTYAEVSAYAPENPVLYLLESLLYIDGEAAPIDDLIERIGFRTIKTEGKKILFNGIELNIKGFCRHEDHPQFGCSLPFQAMDYDLNLIKESGANAIRTSHYPNDELFLDMCDEKGILIWEENHARGLKEEDMRNPNFEAQCSDCITSMIENHYNHPAIIIWGILNECASDTQYGYECYAKQFAQIKSIDSSRPVSFASCRFFNDLCLGLPDIVCYNIYPEWYAYPQWPDGNSTDEMFTRIYDWVQESTEGAGKPFLIGEVGAGAIYGNRNIYHSKWSEERQADILTMQLEKLMEKDECSGMFIWQFCDCRVSEEWFAQRPRTYNNKGVVDEYRRPKLAFDAVKRIYRAHKD